VAPFRGWWTSIQAISPAVQRAWLAQAALGRVGIAVGRRQGWRSEPPTVAAQSGVGAWASVTEKWRRSSPTSILPLEPRALDYKSGSASGASREGGVSLRIRRRRHAGGSACLFQVRRRKLSLYWAAAPPRLIRVLDFPAEALRSNSLLDRHWRASTPWGCVVDVAAFCGRGLGPTDSRLRRWR